MRYGRASAIRNATVHYLASRGRSAPHICDEGVGQLGTQSAVAERIQQRRRGAALEDAIVQAAYDELADVGYTSFTVEGVAARAKTGKASIYRRWPTKQLLVLDALLVQLPTPADCGIVPEIPD